VSKAIVVLLAVVGFLTGSVRSTHAENPVLDAVVGTNDGFDIGLFFPNGERVAVLGPGTYTVVVHDRSSLHNFHLASNFDGTVDFRTDVEFVGDESFTVTFRPGTEYAYACEPHWQVMNGRFRTRAAPATTTTTAPPSVPTLQASVSSAGVVSLSPRAVRAGAVRMVVRDRSRTAGFRLAGPGVSKRTTAAFVGTTTWSLRLGKGSYRFGAKLLSGTLTAR
jgi:plastocyanin